MSMRLSGRVYDLGKHSRTFRKLLKPCRTIYVTPVPYQRQVPHFQGAAFSTSKIFRSESPNPLMDIKFEELRDSLTSKSVVLVDVREPKELVEDGKIPGSLNVPLGEVESAFGMSADQFKSKYGGHLPEPQESQNLVVSCRSGKRASMAIDKIKKQGYERARLYSGSFQDWVASGGPLEKP